MKSGRAAALAAPAGSHIRRKVQSRQTANEYWSEATAQMDADGRCATKA